MHCAWHCFHESRTVRIEIGGWRPWLGLECKNGQPVMLDSSGIAYITIEHSETAVSNGGKSRTRSVDDARSDHATVRAQRHEPDQSPDAALRSSQAALQTFFDGAPFQMGITEMTADQDMILVSVNAVAAASMGLTPEQAQGKRISDLGLPSPNKGVWLDQYMEALNTRRPVHFEQPSLLPGSEQWWAVTLACIGEGPTGLKVG